MQCGEIVAPRYNTIQQGRGGCRACGYKNREEPNKLTHKQAEKVMLKAKVQPIVPYTNAVTPWKSICLVCENIVSPKYNAVASGQGGCVKCKYSKQSAEQRIPEEDAIQFLIESGYQPLEPYSGSHNKWKSECLRCSRTVFPTLSSLKSGQGGCGYCSNRIVDIEAAKRILRENLVKPLEEKPANLKKGWKCQCLRCERTIQVYLTNLYRGSDPCKFCSGKAVDPKSAELLMNSVNLTPLEPYSHSTAKWKCLHTVCNNIVYPMYASIKSGQGGCMFCAEKGMDMNIPSYLYLIENEDQTAFKIGVGNFVKNPKSDRIKAHLRNKWRVLEVWKFDTGAEAYAREQEVLTHIRTNLKLPPFLSKADMPQGGWTETLEHGASSHLALKGIVALSIEGLLSN
jgi:Zn ribbon nucleic-acid-binding protein